MKLSEAKTFQDLERFLREFTNVGGDPAPYDFVGAFALFDAILENLSRYHCDADIDSLTDFPPVLTDQQRLFLRKLALLDQRTTDDDREAF